MRFLTTWRRTRDSYVKTSMYLVGKFELTHKHCLKKKTWILACPWDKQLSNFACPGQLFVQSYSIGSDCRIPRPRHCMCLCALKNEVYNSRCYSYSMRCRYVAGFLQFSRMLDAARRWRSSKVTKHELINERPSNAVGRWRSSTVTKRELVAEATRPWNAARCC